MDSNPTPEPDEIPIPIRPLSGTSFYDIGRTLFWGIYRSHFEITILTLLIKGGSKDGSAPSWSDFLKQMESEGVQLGAESSAPAPKKTIVKKKAPIAKGIKLEKIQSNSVLKYLL